MNDTVLFEKCQFDEKSRLKALQTVLSKMKMPFEKGNSIGIKIHWGEIGSKYFLSPVYAREIVGWLKKQNVKPFVFDTTVLYSGGRRDGNESLRTAAKHGFTEDFLGCPVKIGDGLDGKNIADINAGFKHFDTVQVGKVVKEADGFVILSHFKGHLEASFGGSVKNMSMGFASRAQKQRMHADAKPTLIKNKCIKCGECVDICPSGAASMANDDLPIYDLVKCIGCAQCIAMCPEAAIQIVWNTDIKIFQEKLVETAAAVWKIIQNKTIIINALIDVVAECDCMPGDHHKIAEDKGFVGSYHPILADAESVKLIGAASLDETHPNIPWKRQFEYAREIGFI
jgi:uncharacterized protein